LPFHFSAGIQTSTLMSESEVGVSVAVTRQKAGAFLNTAMPPGPPDNGPPAPGGVNAPAATTDAEVIFPSGSAKDARLSQEAAETDGTTTIALMASTNTNRTKLFKLFLLAEPLCSQCPAILRCERSTSP
jgi:hypothetical protein